MCFISNNIAVCKIKALLVFHRKDLCDARPKPEMSSKCRMGPFYGMDPQLEASGGEG